MLVILIATALPLLVSAAAPTAAPAQAAPAEPIWCTIDKEQPPYMPNIYKCQHNERCCENEGFPSCCGTGITTAAVWEQLTMWIVLIAALLLVGCIAYCYFNDHYCCDGGQQDERFMSSGLVRRSTEKPMGFKHVSHWGVVQNQQAGIHPQFFQDGPTGCLCCKTDPKDRYRQRFDADRHFHPDIVHVNRVDDPIFGRLGKPDDVPAYAHIDEETRRRGAYI